MRTLIPALLVVMLALQSAAAQGELVWAAAPGGLSLRRKPGSGSELLRKIPYGEQLMRLQRDSAIVLDGFHTCWTKVRTATDSGYAVDAWLVPLTPPPPGTASLADWAAVRGSKPAGAVETRVRGIRRTTQLLDDGGVLAVTEGEGYYSESLQLPDISAEEAYVLARNLLVLTAILPNRSGLPRESGRETGRSWRVTFRSDDDPWLRCAEHLHFDRVSGTGAREEVDITRLEDGAVITYTTGS